MDRNLWLSGQLIMRHPIWSRDKISDFSNMFHLKFQFQMCSFKDALNIALKITLQILKIKTIP